MPIKTIKKDSKDYPEGLKHIFRPPGELFINGEILLSDFNAIAIVGTRLPTYYGLRQCEKLSYDLAIRGITVVSGMARGIDTAAHKGAMKAGGRTIAVLGSGHNHIYPPENRKLYNEIIRNGAVISQFPPDTLPLRPHFPMRNRIISGLSKGIVVIEAPQKSGALITADFALEQGREVFAMPGNINSVKSSGTNRLIKEGAKLLESVSDILEELKYVLNVDSVKSDVSERRLSPTDISSISSDEKRIFRILSDKPRFIDEISNVAEFSAARTSKVLLGLELKRLIKALPGKNFVRC